MGELPAPQLRREDLQCLADSPGGSSLHFELLSLFAALLCIPRMKGSSALLCDLRILFNSPLVVALLGLEVLAAPVENL